MPWKETQKMDQKVMFVQQALNPQTNFRQLCREYGVSAKTGYKWMERFEMGGLSGLAEASRRPRSHAKQLCESVVCEIIALKLAHKHWGPKKIRVLYGRRHHEVPSESSFKRVLDKASLTTHRRLRRSRQGGRIHQGKTAHEPNAIWSVDFKGHWRDRQGDKVEPLTVRDEYSRFIFELRAVESSKTEVIRPCFERLFERHGLPEAIRSDNGTPFASSNGLLGLSRLSVWWAALGISLERGRPGCPQDNAAHERMHFDVRRELEAGRIGRDQAAFDLWRHEFNQVRPHESLDMRTPAEVYKDSQRSYDGTPDDLDYGAMTTRKVSSNGLIRVGGIHIAISTALRGWSVGLCPIDENTTQVWFGNLLLGHLDPKTAAFQAAHGQPERPPTTQDA